MRKICFGCEKEIENPVGQQKYCSPECRIKKTNTNIFIDIVCPKCSRTFKASKNAQKKFCSSKCKLDNRIDQKKNKIKTGISASNLGAIGELRVCADLMEKGYHVYRAVSPACPSDLTITCEKKFYRVEVTHGYHNTNGKILHNKIYDDPDRFDIVAVILKNHEIVYIPELPSIIKKDN